MAAPTLGCVRGQDANRKVRIAFDDQLERLFGEPASHGLP